MLKVIIDFDGTLTAEEEQAAQLAERSLETLSAEWLGVPLAELQAAYQATRARLLAAPHLYAWEVRGLVASYCDEGAFILNTSTLQAMLRENSAYARAIAERFPSAEYDPVVDATNHLFHRHTAALVPRFRPGAREALAALQVAPDCTPVILTNSLGDKVTRFLGALGLAEPLPVLGDTRQYDMDPDWPVRFPLPDGHLVQRWSVDALHTVDLRRPVYHRALMAAAADGARLAVVADTFSLPGALPLVMGIPFYLLHTPYTPAWCLQAVRQHPLGRVLGGLEELVALAEEGV